MQEQAKAAFQNEHLSDLYIGETVRLNSGGPDAVIAACNGSEVTIEWQDAVGNTKKCTLPRPFLSIIILGRDHQPCNARGTKCQLEKFASLHSLNYCAVI